jgi:hypothetical protein
MSLKFGGTVVAVADAVTTFETFNISHSDIAVANTTKSILLTTIPAKTVFQQMINPSVRFLGGAITACTYTFVSDPVLLNFNYGAQDIFSASGFGDSGYAGNNNMSGPFTFASSYDLYIKFDSVDGNLDELTQGRLQIILAKELIP